jgi:hypothetical protein
MSFLTTGNAQGKVTACVFFTRADVIPVGPGVAAAIHSDIEADGKKDDNIAADVTDNADLVRYLQTVVFSEMPLFGQNDVVHTGSSRIGRKRRSRCHPRDRTSTPNALRRVS